MYSGPCEPCPLLLLLRLHHVNSNGFFPNRALLTHSYPTNILLGLLFLESHPDEDLMSDLRSLATFQADGAFHLYHQSFSDFLGEESRAKELFVSDSQVYTHLAKCLMQHIIQCPLDFGPCA